MMSKNIKNNNDNNNNDNDKDYYNTVKE